MSAMIKPDSTAHPDVVVTRIYHAPRDLVWRAWTDPKHLKHWWGPHYFDVGSVDVDLRVGGKLRIEMIGPDDMAPVMEAVFREVSPPHRLSFLASIVPDERGVPQLEILTTATFDEANGKTTVTVRNQILRMVGEAIAAGAGMEEGWTQSLERLGGHLGSLALGVPETEPATIITRIFDAPRELMWKAMTDAEHLQHWWGPRAMTNILCEIDARPGGKWRVHQRVDGEQSPGGAPKGSVFKFRGEIREAVPPEKIVQTFGMEGMFEDQTIVETMTLTDLGNGKTLLKVVSVFEGMDDAAAFASRKGMVDSGMSYGANETYQRLAEYLKNML
jgi:uncharacterized protein YndB with AHSA1/START domain